MADFKKAFDFMIHNEDRKLTGIIVKDNNGARVRFGVNEAYHSELTAEGYYNTMSKEQALIVAENLYNNNEWRRIWGDRLTSQKVSNKLLDMAVNMGVNEAVMLAQRAANLLPAQVDGKMGPVTLAEINNMDEHTMLKGLVTWWHWFIEQELKNKPQDKPYEKIWIARADLLSPIEGGLV